MDDAGLQRIESLNRNLAPAIIFAAVTAWFFQTFIMGSDLFWHLAAGRDIWERGTIPRTDPFSHTFGGREWINHEWLWDILYWNIYRIGPDAVAWFNIGVMVVIFTLGYLLAYQTTGSVFASGATIWLSALACHWFLDIRPHVVTLLLVSIVLVTRHHKWALWMWPPLVVLWTNLHAGFVFGIGTLGLMAVVWTYEQSRDANRFTIPWPPWISISLCMLVWMINPFGWKLIGYPWEYLKGDTVYKQLIEWHPPPFGLDPRFFEGGFWWFVILAVIGMFCSSSRRILMIICVAIVAVVLLSTYKERAVWGFVLLTAIALFFGDRRQLYLIALCAVTLAMALKSRRFIPLFAVTSTPLVALAILAIREQLASWIPQLRSAWAGVGASLAALLVATVMWSQVKISSSLLRDWAMGDVYPEEAVIYLKALGPPERLLNYYNWGGFILLHAPGTKVFIDGRANTLYDEAIYNDYQRFLAGQIKKERLARYPTDIAIVPLGQFASALQRLQPPWKRINFTNAAILIPPGSPLLETDLPSKEEVLSDGIQPIFDQVAETMKNGQTEASIELLEQALERQPYLTRAYNLLAHIYAGQKQFDKVDEIIARGLEENPRRAYHFYTVAGSIYQQVGELERALAAWKKAVLRGPFGRREGSELRVERLEKAIARKQRGF